MKMMKRARGSSRSPLLASATVLGFHTKRVKLARSTVATSCSHQPPAAGGRELPGGGGGAAPDCSPAGQQDRGKVGGVCGGFVLNVGSSRSIALRVNTREIRGKGVGRSREGDQKKAEAKI